MKKEIKKGVVLSTHKNEKYISFKRGSVDKKILKDAMKEWGGPAVSWEIYNFCGLKKTTIYAWGSVPRMDQLARGLGVRMITSTFFSGVRNLRVY